MGEHIGISVIIPTYKEPEHLELCLRSALENAADKSNIEIVVYVDGTQEVNQKVIDQYKDQVHFLLAEQNSGMCVGMNRAISFAHKPYCLVVNTDHVLAKHWDQELLKWVQPGRILVLNTIERNGSMFRGVERGNFGDYPSNFNMAEFLEASYDPALESQMEPGLCRLPFVVNKYIYIALGGWDEKLTHGLNADDDFFLKAKVMGLETMYLPQLKFYHFSMTCLNNDNLAANGKQKRTDAEQQNLGYLYQKWGGAIPRHNGETVQLVDPVAKTILIA